MGREMDCRQVQDWLLEADEPDQPWQSPEVMRHLEQCRPCRLMADRLTEIEDAWRLLPDPPEAERAKARFLADLPQVDRRNIPSRQLSRRRWLQWGMVAAAGCSAAGAGLFMLLPTHDARASDALLDELVDWNLRLTEAESAADRRRLYAERAAQLKSAVDQTEVPADQADLDQALLENGTWLASHRDPMGEATRFDGLADRLLDLAADAGEHRRFHQMDRLLKQYNRLMECGINPNVQRAEASGALDFEHQRNVERLALSDEKHLRILTSLLEQAPNASREEIENALKLRGKAAKAPDANKQSDKNNSNDRKEFEK
jgi:hypothetical protein